MATEVEMTPGPPRDGAADAAAPAAPAAAGPDPAVNSISVTAGLLGLNTNDPELDDLKETGKVVVVGGAQKRPKLTHNLFFEDERGFKKMQKTFPQIPFQGKGYEFRDLKLLLAHYDHWIKELYPVSDNTEEIVKRSRVLLSENMKGDDGHVSNPRERLHLLRYEYKAAQALADGAVAKAAEPVPEDVKQRIEANRLRALELKKKREQQSGGAGASSDMDADAKRRIEENKARAMEMKKLREMEELVAEMEGVSANPTPAGPGANASRVQADTFDEEDDPFGFGGGFDDGDFGGGFAPSHAPNKAAAAPKSQAPAATFFDEEEDPFGHAHCGFDDEMPSSMGALPQSAAPAAPPAATMPAPSAAMATPAAATGKPSPMDDDAKRRMEENKARAMRLKRQREEAAAAAAATPAPPAQAQEVAPQPGVHQQVDVSPAPPKQQQQPQQQQRHYFDEEDDVFQYGDGFDDEF